MRKPCAAAAAAAAAAVVAVVAPVATTIRHGDRDHKQCPGAEEIAVSLPRRTEMVGPGMSVDEDSLGWMSRRLRSASKELGRSVVWVRHQYSVSILCVSIVLTSFSPLSSLRFSPPSFHLDQGADHPLDIPDPSFTPHLDQVTDHPLDIPA